MLVVNDHMLVVVTELKLDPVRMQPAQLLLIEFPQRGAAATEGSRRAKCVRSRLGTASRRAERGDSVAHRGRESSGISGRTVRSEKSRTTR